MGKVKELLRSLCARLSTSKFKAHDESIESRESSICSSVARNDTDKKSLSTIEIQATSHNEARITPNKPSFSSTSLTCSETVPLAGTCINFFPRKCMATKHKVELTACAELEVNIAMLRFLHRLPLDELGMIGHGLTLLSSLEGGNAYEEDEGLFPQSITQKSSARLKDANFAGMTTDSSGSFVCGRENRIERNRTRHECRHEESATHRVMSPHSSMADLESHADANTLSLTSKESISALSFACCAARRVEGDHAQQQSDDQASVAGGFAGPIKHNKFITSHSHGDSVGVKADDHDCPFQPSSLDRASDQHRTPAEIEMGTARGDNSVAWEAAGMESAPSFTRRSADSCDLFLKSIGLPIHEDSNPRTDNKYLDDFDMDDLPDWSDVEDDPEYNQFEERSFHWTDTDSSHSSRISIMADTSWPTFSMPSVFVHTDASNTHGNGADSNEDMS